MKYVLLFILVTAFTPLYKQAKLVSVTTSVSDGKVMLDWTVSGNSTADKFEVERSRDAKEFSIVAVVFATEKDGDDYYRFYEKVNSRNLVYRVKLINKDKKTEYSKAIYVK